MATAVTGHSPRGSYFNKMVSLSTVAATRTMDWASRTNYLASEVS